MAGTAFACPKSSAFLRGTGSCHGVLFGGCCKCLPATDWRALLILSCSRLGHALPVVKRYFLCRIVLRLIGTHCQDEPAKAWLQSSEAWSKSRRPGKAGFPS